MSILFLDDWLKYPEAIIHDTTDNKSALHLVKVYDSMGIKNSAFPLALHNKDLLDIDPHDSNLTATEIDLIVEECAENVWYYLREIVRIPPNTGLESIPFRLNRGTVAIYWLFYNHITTIVTQPRQTGKTISLSTLMRYLLNIDTINNKINFMTLDDVLREETIESIRSIEEEFPPYLRLSGPTDSKKNTHNITVNALNNVLRGFLPQRSFKAARNVMRGQTTPIFWIDEGASIYNIDISLPRLLMAGNNVRHEAEKKGAPYGTIITTNAGDKSVRETRYMYNLIQDSTIWSEKFFDCKDTKDLERTIARSNRKKEIRVNATFSHRQLGYPDSWLVKNYKASMAKGADAEQDLLNRWKDGGGDNPISKEDIKVINDSLVDDPRITIEHIGNYVVRHYETEDVFDRIANESGIIIATDTSDAVGNDDISVVITDLKYGAVIAAATINDTNLMSFAEWLANWLIKYDRAVLIPERKSSGVTIIDIVIETLLGKGIDPFTKIFNWVVQDIEKYPEVQRELSKPVNMRSSSIYVKYRKEFGYGTTGLGRASRDNLYGLTLMRATKYTGNLVRDRAIIDQLNGLIEKNGRIDHANGEHDDMVIGWLLANWLLVFGKNLKNYNLVSSDILSHNVKVHNKDSEDRHREQEASVNIKAKIKTIMEDLVKEKDPILKSRKELVLKKILDESSGLLDTAVSFEELKNNIELEKRRRR